MKIASQNHTPNSPIVFEDILITHINGHSLEKPIASQVVLHFTPTFRTVIESENLPIEVNDHRMESPFVVTIADKGEVPVVLERLNEPISPNGKSSGALALAKSPFTVIHRDEKITSIRFSVLNFPKFFGGRDTWIGRQCVGATTLTYDRLQVKITQDLSLSQNKEYLNETNGYSVTLNGVIRFTDGAELSVDEAKDILRGLRAFLSFARGAACGLTLVNTTLPDDKSIFFEWGTTYTEPWHCGYDTWLPTIVDGGKNLSLAFNGFWMLYSNPNWKNVLTRVIDLYLNSKSTAYHVGIILIQAALESLCSRIADPKNKTDTTGEYLSDSIKHIGLCTSIPSSCKSLAMIFQNNSSVNGDGLIAITKLRNDIVHPNQKCSDNTEAWMEALKLGQWYIEMILLKQFSYSGRYRNRLAKVGESVFEMVPWTIQEPIG
ncbi:MAG: hypothetical protein F4039_07465 [Gammaproteobacteria bacterium]|nr:hypothetical protein [Gammaproteobacteria bacterium]MYF54035.1 hypothetical protein [Gammaproteobacteria bacterium]MYK43907.1 hypothetical protein [Gammaproteobacteria bacterium]